jgi:hypothetical protein
MATLLFFAATDLFNDEWREHGRLTIVVLR